MTQHILEEHTIEDHQTMKRLGTVIGLFIVATVIMATTVSVIF